MILFESWSRGLLLLHLLAAVAALGAGIHLVCRAMTRWRGAPPKAGLERLHTTTLLISYNLCWLLGAVIYPTFRVRVRADLLDPQYPWASGLFELKEHLATIGLVCVWCLWLLVRSLATSEPDDRRMQPLVIGLVAILLTILVYNAGTGWYLTCLKAVG